VIPIQTAKGPIDIADLGRVLVHEHVFSMDMEYTLNYRPDFVEHEQIEEAARRLNALKQLGIDTIMDLTVLGLGRNVPRIGEVARRSEVNIIVATGCFTLDEIPKALAKVGPGLMFNQPDPLPDMFVRDIEIGVHGTQIKAAVLKCAIDAPGLTLGVERVMRAVGQANVRTGAPITVHTSAYHHTGLVAQRVLKEEGVDLRDVIIGHCGDTTDLDYLMRLADEGSILAMDRFGMNIMLPLEKRVATVAEMVKRGYGDRLALSHDCFCWSDFFPTEAYRAQMFPEHSYCYVPQTVVPALLEAGVTQDQIDKMQIDNPRRHFEHSVQRSANRNNGTSPAVSTPVEPAGG
jgi:phosphotriesterase-related protein